MYDNFVNYQNFKLYLPHFLQLFEYLDYPLFRNLSKAYLPLPVKIKTI